MSRKKGNLRIGTSGYQYDHWKGIFYPEDCKKKDWFDYYSKKFNTVEINNTFYHLPEENTFDDWENRAPEDFLYAVKFSRYGTHMKKLKDSKEPVNLFLERVKRLKKHLGPILVQLPPNWSVNTERLEEFLKNCPDDYQWTLEIRDPSWLCEDVYRLLTKYQAALCIHDMLEDHPEILTCGWTYLRFHGNGYDKKYSHQYLSARAQEINEWLDDGMDVFAYFNNDAKGYAVENAFQLREYLSS
jgi:uncharacterized protein YecE (DUF72 family)